MNVDEEGGVGLTIQRCFCAIERAISKRQLAHQLSAAVRRVRYLDPLVWCHSH